MRVGVLVSGDTAVRAAHSLSAHPGIEEVVVIGPARSRNFRVTSDPSECDLLIGTGGETPARAVELGLGLVWDGDRREEGVVVWGASPAGLTLAMASRETDPRVVALAHPELADGTDHTVRFPDPIGQLRVTDTALGGRRVALAHSPNQFAACLAVGAERGVTMIDDGAFMSGIALAAGVLVAGAETIPVWHRGLDYLQTATAMGLVMADDR